MSGNPFVTPTGSPFNKRTKYDTFEAPSEAKQIVNTYFPFPNMGDAPLAYAPTAGGDMNYMLMSKPRYPDQYFGYRAIPRSSATFARYGPRWSLADATQRANRYNDSYWGQGRYRKRRYRGKGMYLGSSFGGSGNYFKRMMHRQFNRTVAGKTPLGHLGKRLGRAAIKGAEGYIMSGGNPKAGLAAAGVNLATGAGSYKVAGSKGNHLIDGMGSGVPTFSSASDETGALAVQHTEYVRDIYGIQYTGSPATPTTNIKSDIIVINPGLSNSFPWLSQIAANYEEYEIKQLMYCYKSKVSDNLTSSDGQIGSIIMFTEYNANDAMKKTKQQLLQSYASTNALINTGDVLHGVECDTTKLRGDGHKYMRVGSLANSPDLSDYDWAKLQVAVVDTPEQLSNQVVGELYVSYTVVLRKPRLYSTLALNLQEDQFYLKTTDNFFSANAEKSAAETNSIGCNLSTINAGSNNAKFVLTFPASFSGDIELMLALDAAASNAVTKVSNYNTTTGAWVEFNSGAGFLCNVTGNIVGIDNIPVTEAATDPEDVSPAGQLAQPRNVLVHLRVAQASHGIDNSYSWVVDTGGSAAQLWVKVARYNGHELDTAPIFKKLLLDGTHDPAGAVTTITN